MTTFWSREAPDFGHLLQSEVPERIEAPRGGFRIEASSIAIDGPSPTNEAKHFLKWQVPAIAVGGGEHAEIYVVIPDYTVYALQKM